MSESENAGSDLVADELSEREIAKLVFGPEYRKCLSPYGLRKLKMELVTGDIAIETKRTLDTDNTHTPIQHFERGQQILECRDCGERHLSRDEFSGSCEP